jgi:hypothetical protein
MSFGFSVGDVIALSTIVCEAHSRYKVAPREYRDLLSQFLYVSLCLGSIAEKIVKRNGIISSPNMFHTILEGSQDLLKELLEHLSRHGSLGSSSPSVTQRTFWSLHSRYKGFKDRINDLKRDLILYQALRL